MKWCHDFSKTKKPRAQLKKKNCFKKMLLEVQEVLMELGSELGSELVRGFS